MPVHNRRHGSTHPTPLPEEKDNNSNQSEPSNNKNSNNSNQKKQSDDGIDSDQSPASSDGELDEFVEVNLSDLRKEFQCPICLGVIRKTRTVMECLHRFCKKCIDKAMRLGNNECPACRTHCASRRSLRDDPNYDKLIAAIHPDIDKYEEEELIFHEDEKAKIEQIQESIAAIARRQSEALRKRSRDLRKRRHQRAMDDDEEDLNENYSSSGDEGMREVKPKGRGKRSEAESSSHVSVAVSASAVDSSSSDTKVKTKTYKRRSSQPSTSGPVENNPKRNRLLSAELMGNSKTLTWGKGGMRSHRSVVTKEKLPSNTRLSKLINNLRSSNENVNEMEISLVLVCLHDAGLHKLQDPYLSCKPKLTVKHLCNYVAQETSIKVDDIEMFVIKDLQSTSPTISTLVIDPSKDKLELVNEHQSLAEIKNIGSYSHDRLVLAYRQKS